jgi:hypothetical protein
MHRTDPTTPPLPLPIFNGQYGFRSKKVKMSEILKLCFNSLVNWPNKDMYMKLTQTALTTVGYLRGLILISGMGKKGILPVG